MQQATGPPTHPSSPQHSANSKPKPLVVSCETAWSELQPKLFICAQSKRVLDLPTEPAHNIYHEVDQLPVCTHLTRTGGFQPSRSIQAHSYAATALDLHPTKPIVATASDDHTWNLWTISR